VEPVLLKHGKLATKTDIFTVMWRNKSSTCDVEGDYYALELGVDDDGGAR